jgi:murein DD-endopeptidase MepM/ murein hydrolase activator NlpD
MGYAYPVGDIYVSADWANHKNRTPPSSEPGTDYASSSGTTVDSPGAGTIEDVKSSNSSATGRYVTVSLDDGRTARALHLSSTSVSKGQRVSKGQKIGVSGASGYGSDWYYGSHLHQTLWPGNIWAAPTIDFEKYVGGSTPPPEDDMKVSSFKKDFELDTDGTQTIRDGEAEFLLVTKSPVNTKIATGPNDHISAVAYIAFDNLPIDPLLEAVQVEPIVSERQKDGSLADTSLGRQEVRGTPGYTRVLIPIETRLSTDDKYLRIKVHAPAGSGDVLVLGVVVRGGEFTN